MGSELWSGVFIHGWTSIGHEFLWFYLCLYWLVLQMLGWSDSIRSDYKSKYFWVLKSFLLFTQCFGRLNFYGIFFRFASALFNWDLDYLVLPTIQRRFGIGCDQLAGYFLQSIYNWILLELLLFFYGSIDDWLVFYPVLHLLACSTHRLQFTSSIGFQLEHWSIQFYSEFAYYTSTF